MDRDRMRQIAQDTLHTLTLAARANMQRDGMLHPTAIILHGENMTFVSPDFDEPNGKSEAEAKIRSLVKKTKAEMVCFISEGWVRKVAMGDPLAAKSQEITGEVIAVNLQLRSGETFGATIPITRGVNDQPILGETEFNNNVQCRYTDVFDPPKERSLQ